MILILSGTILLAAIAVSARVSASQAEKAAPTKSESKIIECRVLEAHASAE
jgi:hypothetical protein